MTDRIEPALTSDEWAEVLDVLRENAHKPTPHYTARARVHRMERGLSKTGWYETIGDSAEENAYLIAVNNAALPDSDPRKITPQWVNDLRIVADFLDLLADDATEGWRTCAERVITAAKLRERADALESYLPPAK